MKHLRYFTLTIALTALLVGCQGKKTEEASADAPSNCLLCEAELENLPTAESMRCDICGNETMSHTRCPKGHFVCDSCRIDDPVELVLSVCRRTQSDDPIEIAQALMDHPAVHMHGPEHHVLVGAVLLAAYKNAGGDIDLPKALNELSQRAQEVPGAACGNWGACGAALSTGMYMSLITGNGPLKEQEWHQCNTCTACALGQIADHGGPRCCKRDSFIAIATAARQTEQATGIRLHLPDTIRCHYFPNNNTCLGKECPFFPGGQVSE